MIVILTLTLSEAKGKRKRKNPVVRGEFSRRCRQILRSDKKHRNSE